MVLPGPQGTVQYPIRAPNEHSPRTKIMEKSLALFFYSYQSMVHLQSSLSAIPLPSALSSSLFLSLLPSMRPPLPPLSISTCVLFSHLDLLDTGGGGLALSVKAPSYLLCFFSPLFYAWAYSAYCVCSHHWACLKSGAMATIARVGKKGSRIMKIIVRFV